ncbi:MAG: rhodanese-like domain-containing protein [Fusobacteriaceae bacterium]
MKKLIIVVGIVLIGGIAFFSKTNDTTSKEVKSNVISINSEETKNLLSENKAILLDVRTPEVIKKEGYVKNSLNIPLEELEARIGELDKNATYITFCSTNRRSGKANEILVSSGFEKIYYDTEGIKKWPYEKEEMK